jgi:hypothetical protein
MRMRSIISSRRMHAVVVSCCLAGAAMAQLRLGAESTPAPVRELIALGFGYETETSARLIVAAEFALAASVALVGRSVLTVGVAVLAAFVSLACLSAGFRNGSVWVPTIALGGFVGLALLAARGARDSAEGAAVRSRRGLSPAWSLIGAIAIATLVARVGATTDFHRESETEAAAKARAMSIDLDMKPFVGTALSESPIGTYMPSLAARVGQETAFIVFYNPNCDACHNLFEASFAEPRMELVFAVEIPPPPGAVIAAHDGLGPIQCPGCSFESLPPGPIWLVAPPMTVKVERGVITCVADRFGGDCINPQ